MSKEMGNGTEAKSFGDVYRYIILTTGIEMGLDTLKMLLWYYWRSNVGNGIICFEDDTILQEGRGK